MTSLNSEKCTACRRDSPPITIEEKTSLLPQISHWNLVDEEDIPKLDRSFKFKNFVDALAFTNIIGDLAETQGHHPKLITEWGSVQVTWWTHKIRNLHRNDFVMAAKTDQIYQETQHASYKSIRLRPLP